MDAVTNYSPSNLRNLFVVLLNIYELSEPSKIWQEYKVSKDIYMKDNQIKMLHIMTPYLT